MNILLTNDDGVRSPGTSAVARVVSRIGKIVICAPDREMSACGHAMTLRDPLRLSKVPLEDGWEAYEVNGLPVDCVNLALAELFPSGCDLLISGINNGPNLGWDATYSGTVGGALEGAINGIRSIAISVAKFVEDAPPHFETAERWLEEWLDWLLNVPLPPYCILNVNVPSIAYEEIRGTRLATMGMRIYEDRVEKRYDPWGRPYYWQGGVVVMDRTQAGTDVYWVNEGFVSITPLRLDWTDYDALESLEKNFPGKRRAK